VGVGARSGKSSGKSSDESSGGPQGVRIVKRYNNSSISSISSNNPTRHITKIEKRQYAARHTPLQQCTLTPPVLCDAP